MPRSKRLFAQLFTFAFGFSALGLEPARADEGWPDLSRPASAIGGGEADAGVVVGIEGYGFVPPVPGAEANAKAWYDYLTRTRGAAPANVKLLLGNDATREDMLDAARRVAAKAGPGGTLWFVFVGHGAASRDGKDGLLIGVDAQQKAKSLQTRSLRRGELLAALSKSRAGSISVILDACFSGRSQDGSPIAPGLQPLVTVAAAGAADPRMVVLTAAKGDQFAGALPGSNRPAFSYLTLGAIRGWAGGKDGRVTAGSIWRYATGALEATLRGRNQTPDLIGNGDTVLGRSARESGPDLAELAKATAGRPASEMFRVSEISAVPEVRAPAAMPEADGGADWRGLDIQALKRLDEATRFEKGGAAAEEKAEKWRALARAAPAFAGKASARAVEWERYARESAAAEDARLKREHLRDGDWGKLRELLPLAVVPEPDKRRWAMTFVKAYGKSYSENPYVFELEKHLPKGSVVMSAAERRAAEWGIEWVSIPGGNFMMGSSDGGRNEKPVHRVTVRSFQMAKTEVTFGQYRECVKAGACTPAHVSDGTCYVYDGSGWKQGTLPMSFQGDDYPVVCVDWEQAKAYSEWVGGRLPSEAEWEYAARGGGRDIKYPWGDGSATCARAVMKDGNRCGRSSTWRPVCSKISGNTMHGLCDMAGNVWEWTQDWYHRSYKRAPSDGSAWERPAGSTRVIRGGSVFDYAGNIRAARRDGGGSPDLRVDGGGFRPVR